MDADLNSRYWHSLISQLDTDFYLIRNGHYDIMGDKFISKNEDIDKVKKKGGLTLNTEVIE